MPQPPSLSPSLSPCLCRQPFQSAVPHPLPPSPPPSPLPVGQAAGPPAIADGPSAVLHLSWGLLQCLLHQQGGGGGGAGGQPQQHPQAGEEARKPLLEGAAAGAFAYLRQVWLGGGVGGSFSSIPRSRPKPSPDLPPSPQVFAMPLFKLDDGVHQEVVACVVYRLVGQALQADQAVGG